MTKKRRQDLSMPPLVAHCYAARAVVSNTLSSHVFEKARVGFEPTPSVDYGDLID